MIETVKAGPEAAAQPKRRARRSKEEMAAGKAQGLISVFVDGCALVKAQPLTWRS